MDTLKDIFIQSVKTCLIIPVAIIYFFKSAYEDPFMENTFSVIPSKNRKENNK